MIRLNCNILIKKSETRPEIIKLATELVSRSQSDRGCISYDLYGSFTNPDHLMIIETWDNAGDLAAHSASDHFQRIVPRLRELSDMTLQQFEF